MRKTKAIKNTIKRKNGITLIALVITVIVLLILAGISISMIAGDNSILQRAAEAKTKTERAEIIENAKLDVLGTLTANKGDGISEEDLTGILEKYGVLSDKGEASVLDKTLTTTNGGYEISVKEIYDGEFTEPNLTPGLYKTGTNELIKPWEEIIREKIFKVSNVGLLERDTGYAADKLDGKLVIHPDVKSLAGGVLSESAITGLVLPNGIIELSNSSISSCKSLTDVKIPSSVTTITSSAFRDCTSLEKIVIPDSVQILTNSAFSNCTNLTYIKIGNGITNCDGYPITVSSIKKTIVIDTLKCLNKNFLEPFFNNNDIIIGDSITAIPEYNSQGISNVEKLIIGKNVETIGQSAFYSWNGLKKLTVPSNVKTVGANAFSSCQSLEEITVEDGVKTLESQAFAYCQQLKKATIPNSVTSLGNKIFANCYQLQTVELGNGITKIPYTAFGQCTSLKSIIIPEGVTELDDYSFELCSSLENISIPGSVTSIKRLVFQNCNNLTSITYLGTRAQWNEITKDNNWKYSSSITKIKCTDGDIDL